MNKQKIIRRLPERILSGGVALLLGASLLCSCSQDDGPVPDADERVPVNFTASVEGVTLPLAKAASTGQQFTGTTDAGVPYRDYTDANGFATRSLYLGAAVARLKNHTNTRTTADGNEWVDGDAVGIFMLKANGNIPSDISEGADNIKHIATPGTSASEASFAPANAGETIYYPQSGEVDFVAYYPYGEKGAGIGKVDDDSYTYQVSVTNQSQPETIDLLYAKAPGIAKNKTPVNLTFNHALSKITLNVKAGTDIQPADISNLTDGDITFNGMPVEAGLSLQEGTVTAGTDVSKTFNPLKATTEGGAQATFRAILIPQPAGGTGRTVVFTIGGNPYTWTIPKSEAFEAGKHYTYPVTVDKTGVTVGEPAINLWNTNGNGSGEMEVLDAVKIPAGDFMMGSPESESGHQPNETQHWVTLSQDFYMSKYQITNTQYATFLNAAGIGKNGVGEVIYNKDEKGSVKECQVLIWDSKGPDNYPWGVTFDTDNHAWKVATAGYENHPVVFVSWYGAKAYADWAGGALPSEAQWEYACRAESEKAYCYGDPEKEDLADYAWYRGNNGRYEESSYGTKKVGLKKPNKWGLHDMHGNVWEWCLDWYGDNYYEKSPPKDPAGPPAGSERVMRGGHWFHEAQKCRSAYRDSAYPNDWYFRSGFRVVFVP